MRKAYHSRHFTDSPQDPQGQASRESHNQVFRSETQQNLFAEVD